MRPVVFAGHEFRYLRCRGCHSLVCHPMPDAEVLTAMYGPGYAALTAGHYEVDSPRDTAEVIAFLRRHPPGRILDFGCGPGDLIQAVQSETEWTPIGVEFEPSVAASTRNRTGAAIHTYADFLNGHVPPVEALHLGDVIEHLTELDRQMPDILRLIQPDGHLLAEGPLQCGPALFEMTIQATQLARSSRPVSAPPTHVLQATASGQRRFFVRHGLTETSFVVYEVDWPAPSRLLRQDLRHPRTVALYALRRLSRPLSRQALWGNRYRYVGSV